MRTFQNLTDWLKYAVLEQEEQPTPGVDVFIITTLMHNLCEREEIDVKSLTGERWLKTKKSKMFLYSLFMKLIDVMKFYQILKCF